MVNVDQKLIFQSSQAGALHGITLKDDDGVIVSVDLGGVNDGFRAGERVIKQRDRIAQDDRSTLAHLAQDLGQGQR